ncbi:MAG: hypothetical protein HC904_11295 [Blastochloris sp.]|nr:hypothetical protein [Blastochloris sp.]
MKGEIFDYHRSAVAAPRKLYQGADAWYDRMLGWWERRPGRWKELETEAALVEERRRSLEDCSEEELDGHLREQRLRVLERGWKERKVLQEALALSGEVMRREKGMTPHGVQMAGALAMSRGWLAEMATGEGKTLTVTLWAVVAGWRGRPCHIVTSNDYLASRDAVEMAGVYGRCGLRVAAVTGEMDAEARREAYGADLVYTTSKELLADFLKDRLVLGTQAQADLRLVRCFSAPDKLVDGELLQRGLHTAIVDEADNVLIDEAVIPLRISQKYRNEGLRQAYGAGSVLARECVLDEDYVVEKETRSVHLTRRGLERLDGWRPRLPLVWRGRRRGVELLEQCLVAHVFFHRDKEYVVQEGKIVIVDGFSGRLMPDRSWSQGLHQAIEAKEGVEMSDPTETLASLSFQKFFRLFRHLSGLSGTALEAAAEFWHIYRLPVLAIPTHLPKIRVEERDRMVATLEEKWREVCGRVEQLHGQGKPVLVGTQNVAESELLGKMLAERGLGFQLLNAVRFQAEAEIVAQAGGRGMITIATNMAGRGTDIKLGEGCGSWGGFMCC